MPMTLAKLIAQYPAWQVQEIAAGWVAIRKQPVPCASGLSNVRCGATLDELAANLQAETRQGSGEQSSLRSV